MNYPVVQVVDKEEVFYVNQGRLVNIEDDGNTINATDSTPIAKARSDGLLENRAICLSSRFDYKLVNELKKGYNPVLLVMLKEDS